MGALLERADQAISVTEVSRASKAIFDRLRRGEQDRLVVMKKPAAIMLSVKAFEALVDELADLRVEAIARRRRKTVDRKRLLSNREMMRRFG